MERQEHIDSYYAASANPSQSYPALEGELRCDVCVVGGGFTGVSTALHLAERGYDVVLLEANRIGWGATGRNGGQVLGDYACGMAKLEKWYSPEDCRRLFSIAEEGKQIIKDRVARHAIDCDLKWGYLHAAEKPSHLDDCKAELEHWREAYDYQALELLSSHDEVRQYVGSPLYTGGLIDRDSGHVHPLNLVLGLAQAAKEAGVRIYEKSAMENWTGGANPIVNTRSGRVKTNHLVLAGNAYMRKQASTLRRTIMPVGTWVQATEPLTESQVEQVLPSDFAVADLRFVINYFRLSGDKRMLFGGGVSYSTLDPPDLVGYMRKQMLRTFPQLADVGTDYCWGGNVAITQNRAPDFGRLADNVLYAHGFSGHGVALTHVAGKLLAEVVAGQAERFDLISRISHRTFPGGPMLRTPLLVLAMLYYRLRDML